MVEAKVGGRVKGMMLRLGEDVRIVPETELPNEVRGRLGRQEGRFALLRPGMRTSHILVDGEIAALLEEFEQPSGIADAVIRFASQQQRDPQEFLREIFPKLQLLVERRFLVDVDDDAVDVPRTRTLEAGDRIGDLVIVRPLQRMEDTEVFQVRLANRRFGALKIERCRSSPVAHDLAREAAVLRLLAGDPSPELLATGEFEDRQYLVLEWRRGSNVLVAVEVWRHRQRTGASMHLRDVCCRILETYGRLHRCGVVHGDINSGNVMIDRHDAVTLLDFQTAAPLDPACGFEAPRGRAGVPIYLEPEYAKTELDGRPPPPATPLGEQYSLAALVYQILTGESYLDFDLRRDRMLEQIVEQPPASFADRGSQPWPAVEEVLARALSKEPEQRFASVDEMAAALAGAEAPGSTRRTRSVPKTTLLDEVIGLTIGKAAQGGEWATQASTLESDGSVYRGAAGVAVALLQISRAMEQPALLEDTDAWIRRAIEELPQSGTSKDETGAAALVGSAGVHLVEAMIASALDQPDREERALHESLCSVATEPLGSDLYDGRSGRLLTVAFLLDRFGEHPAIDRREVEELGRQTLGCLWSDLDQRPKISDTIGDIGMAHGWAGHLYSTLRWCRSVGSEPPIGLERRLHELAGESVPVGRGLMWPWRLPLGGPRSPQFTAGWCNGSAGFVLLWTAAAKTLGGEPWLELARGAAWNAWESAQRDGSLCCGLAGRAYSLLHFFRETGDEFWVDRARDLARVAVREGVFDSNHPWGLFQGELGVALLAADLHRPDLAWFPFLSDEHGV